MEQATTLARWINRSFDELEELLYEIVDAGELAPRLQDAVLSYGESLSSRIVTAGFGHAGIDAVHLDSRRVIVTDDRHTRAGVLFDETNALLRRMVRQDKVTVLGGFIGATEGGVTTTLGRGGSDYTAAIVGGALSADEIQIWTDVDGMMTCDPRIVPEAHCVRAISYREAEDMAKAGAKVLHPATVLPAIRQRIPIVIRNSRNPDAAGTRIEAEARDCAGAVLSIACKADVSLLHIRPRNTPLTSEFGEDIWEVLRRRGIEFELVSPARKEFSLVVDTSCVTPELLHRLNEMAEVNIERDQALVTLIGHNASRAGNNIVRASQRLARYARGGALTCCTDSRFAFAVPAESLVQAATELHQEFFSQPNPAFFVVRGSAAPAEQTRVNADSRSRSILQYSF